jgi:hypothetical protein
VNHLDPNAPPTNSTVGWPGVFNATATSRLANFTWPAWSSNASAPPMMLFTDPHQISLTTDTYRADAISLLIDISSDLGI